MKPYVSLEEYAPFTNTTAAYPGKGTGSVEELLYLTLGLCGESGEVAEKLKKLLRDNVIDRDAVKKELGDVAWYWTRLCEAWGWAPGEVLAENMLKLADRKARGTLHG